MINDKNFKISFMKHSIEVIAKMQITEYTDYKELAKLCISIANNTLEVINHE